MFLVVKRLSAPFSDRKITKDANGNIKNKSAARKITNPTKGESRKNSKYLPILYLKPDSMNCFFKATNPI